MKSFLAAHPGVQVSHVTDIGLREYMEDRLDVRVIGSDGLLMTICDGHGGSACANFVIKRYPLVVAERLSAKQCLHVLIEFLYYLLYYLFINDKDDSRNSITVVLVLLCEFHTLIIRLIDIIHYLHKHLFFHAKFC